MGSGVFVPVLPFHTVVAAKPAEPGSAQREADLSKISLEQAADEAKKLAEVLGFLKLARRALEAGDQKLADDFLQSIGSVELEDAQLRVAFVEIAEVFEKMGQPVKAAAVYEKLVSMKENDLEAPKWLMRLGEIYREMGAYATAISRFYSVINSSIRLGGGQLEALKAMSRRAQREIADVYFLKGEFDQAQRFYNMALRSDLSPDDRAIALFRAGHCTFMRSDINGAVTAFERFLKDYPEHASAPEVRYMLASAFRAQGRLQDAYETVFDLLRVAQSRKEKDPKAWMYWQKKAGNEFANDYYQLGEFTKALTLYQNLVKISTEPDWHWPVIYQMGLCYERLRMELKAKESYLYIVEESQRPELKGKKLPENLANLLEMAKWRSEQLKWEGGASSVLRGLAGSEVRGRGNGK